MTTPLGPPPKKDPQRRTRTPLVPPSPRSRAAHALAGVAARGAFRLQTCSDCGTVQYPPRDACRACLSTDLPWRPVSPLGTIVARSTVRSSIDPYFRERTPWEVCTVRLDAGPSIIAHRHGDAGQDGDAVRLAVKLDKAGNAAMIALPREDTPDMSDDRQLREFTADPKHRRCLVTDGRTPFGQAIAHALLKAGAASVHVGIARPWLPFDGQDALAQTEGIEIVPLDVTDTRSVEALAGTYGGKTDILVNTADHVRPTALIDRDGIAAAQDAFATNTLGLMRLAQTFGRAMRSRGADGDDSAAAFVTVHPIEALIPSSAFAVYDASHAAALSLAQALRTEMRTGGVRVVTVLTGPVDDDWRQPLPPPKVTPNALDACDRFRVAERSGGGHRRRSR